MRFQISPRFRSDAWICVQAYVSAPPGQPFEGVDAPVLTQIPDADQPPVHFMLAVCLVDTVDHLVRVNTRGFLSSFASPVGVFAVF